jgi:hypothetical protein
MTRVPDVCAAATPAHPTSERLTKTAEVAKSRRRRERRERDMTQPLSGFEHPIF